MQTQREFEQIVRSGIPILTNTNRLPMNILMSVMGTTAISIEVIC